MNRAEAEELTGRIRSALDHAWPKDLLFEAWATGAWRAMGYPKWEAYTATEFVMSLIRVPRDERQEVARDMATKGMSTRAISAAMGVDQKTIVNDLRAGEEFSSPEKIHGLDGKTYTRRPMYEAQLTAPVCAPVVLREEKLNAIKEWGWAGVTLAAELSHDEREVMFKAIDRLETEMNQMTNTPSVTT